MRWIFCLLLLMNIALFAWQQRQVPSVGGVLELNVAKPTSGPSGQKLQMLSEVGLSGQQQHGLTSDKAEVDDSRCMVVGGFESEGRAQQLEQRLLSLDIAVRLVSTEASFGSDHWVYIPPLASAQASLRLLRELQSRGVDGYLITEGELINGILLGVFPRLELALGVAEKMRASGYAPQVRELPRVYQQYWLQIAEKDWRLLDAVVLDRVRTDFSDLKHQLISCSGVAHR